MSINISPNQDRAKLIGTGSVGAVAGMSAYYLPVRKDSFVRNDYEIIKNNSEEKILKFNEAAMNISSGNRLKAEQRLFLSQEGIAETVADINAKVNDLRKIIIDNNHIKTVKEDLANNFANFKKSEALRDAVASKSFQKIRWTNFAWGAGIGFVLASVLSKSIPSQQQPPSV